MRYRLTGENVSFQMLISGERLAAIGTEHHFRWGLANIVVKSEDGDVVDRSSGSAFGDSVRGRPGIRKFEEKMQW